MPVIDGDRGAAGHLELGDDIGVEEIVEPSGHSVAAGQAAFQLRIGAQQPWSCGNRVRGSKTVS